MDPITHWVDIDVPPESLYAGAIVCAVVWIVICIRRTLRKSRNLK